MSRLDDFLASFRVKTATPDMSMVLLRAGDSLKAMREAQASGLSFLGFEGFHIFPQGGVQPDQALSIDAWDYRDSAEEDFLRDAVRILESSLAKADVAFDLSFVEGSSAVR